MGTAQADHLERSNDGNRQAESVPSRKRSVRRTHCADLSPEALLAQATLWQWAARAFAYPEQDLLADLQDPERRRKLDRAAAVCSVSPPVPLSSGAKEGVPIKAEKGSRKAGRRPSSQHTAADPQWALAAVWAAVDGLNGAALSLAEEHTALFARRVVAPPHGTVYGAELGLGRVQDLAKVGGFYQAFGLQVSTARPELPDHVCAELEFVAVLLAKEAYARAHGWNGRTARVARARRLFLREHLEPWFSRFAERLTHYRRLDFYPALATLVLALLADEC